MRVENQHLPKRGNDAVNLRKGERAQFRLPCNRAWIGGTEVANDDDIFIVEKICGMGVVETACNDQLLIDDHQFVMEFSRLGFGQIGAWDKGKRNTSGLQVGSRCPNLIRL